jgi:hypothetical protein
MINLKEYIKEGLFDDVDKLEGKNGLVNNIKFLKNEIIEWIVSNTKKKVYKTKFKFDMTTTPPTVNYDGDIEFEYNIDSLNNNGMFQWGEVKGSFCCSYCNSLKSLKGAPEKVGGNFYCRYCDSLTSLEGAPKAVSGYFSCRYCDNLISLEGSPEKLKGYFNCDRCKSLKSLKGAPKEVSEDFYCRECGTQFTEDDVKKVSNVKGKIVC